MTFIILNQNINGIDLEIENKVNKLLEKYKNK